MAAVNEIPTKSKIGPEVTRDITPEPRLITAREYQLMAEMGVLDEDEQIELIEGRMVHMPPKSIRHALATSRANRCFNHLLGDRAIVRVQDPILLNDYSEPEPDIVLAASPDTRYLDHHPTPKEILLVMEISDSSLAYDRAEKCPLFARNRILQFCLLNLNDRELEDFRDPSRSGYRSKQTYTERQSFNLVAFPRVHIRVRDLLPPVKGTGKRRRK